MSERVHLISALSLIDAPDLKSLMKISQYIDQYGDVRDSTFDHDLLERLQVCAVQIIELEDLVRQCAIPDFPIVFCHQDSSTGVTFLEDDIPWSVVFLDNSKMTCRDDVREVYIHEAAHLVASDQDHDFKFALIHGLFRAYAGYAQSSKDYDFRGVDIHGLSIQEAKCLSAAVAEYSVVKGVPLSAAVQAAFALAHRSVIAGANGQSIIETFRRAIDF